MKELAYLNPYLWKHKWKLILGILFVIISNYFQILQPQEVRKSLDTIIAFLQDKNRNETEFYENLFYFGMVILGYALLMGLFMFFMRQTIIVMSREIEYDLREDIFKHYTTLDPHFFKLLQWLRSLGIEPVIVSDNFKPIIEQILIHKEIKGLKVYANQLRFLKDGLSLSFPYQNKNCLMCAHCKKTQFKKIDPTGKKKIIYIGDGRSDICAALASDVVFAKDTLLKYFKKHQLHCLEFSGLVDVHDQLQEIFNGAVVASR